MKIGLVTPYDYPYPGGVTEHVRYLDREFRALGHDTRIIAPSSEPHGALASNVIKVSGDVLPVRGNGSIARITLAPEVSRRVEEIIKAERFDIIHLHEPEVPLLGWAVLNASHTINVGTFHAYSEHPRLIEYSQPFMKWVDSRLDGCILVSPALRDSRASCLPAEYRIIPNGIDYARFAAAEFRPVAPFDDGRPNILFVGRLDARKGFIHLLHAFPAIKQAVPDARLLVVGAFGEEEKARLAKYVRTEDWQDIHFIGRVSREELPRYYRTATLFCAPSTGGESFGIVLLEAMAAGLPVVASDIAGYRSVMQDGAQGRLVPPGDKEAIAQAITRLLREPERREQMAARGRATAARYDWHVVAPRVLDYYQELIRTRRANTCHRVSISHSTMPRQKAAGVSTMVEYLMKGLGRFESLWASGNPIYR